MPLLLLVLLPTLAACHKATQPTPVPVPPAELATVELIPAEEPAEADGGLSAVVLALSARDAGVDCAAVAALASDPVATLILVVDTVKMPPAAPMRAAACLLDHHADAAADVIVGWMAGPDSRGLALLVSQRFDAVPVTLAVRAAAAGNGGPWAADLREAVEKSARPEVRAVLAP